jgi:hypothetical protein
MITASFRALLLPRCVLAQSIIRALMQRSDVAQAGRVGSHRARNACTTRVA